MRLLGITDLHGNPRSLERIVAEAGPVDAVLLGGDITHFGSPEGVEEAVRLAGASGGAVLAVAGNCDSA
jgi:Icc-related predicted phosphoesterase